MESNEGIWKQIFKTPNTVAISVFVLKLFSLDFTYYLTPTDRTPPPPPRPGGADADVLTAGQCSTTNLVCQWRCVSFEVSKVEFRRE